MTLKIKSALCLCCAFAVTSVFGNDITVDALARGGAFARDRQLRDFEQVFKPGTSGFFGFDMMYLPLPTQTRLSSEYGTHDGYAFRHRLEGYFSAPVARTGVDFGILWFAERHGWDNEDFVAFPYYGKFSVVRSEQLAGATLSLPKYGLGAAGGIQYQNVERIANIYPDESDTLYWWGEATSRFASAQALFHGADPRMIRLSLNLESKELWGGASSGITTYLPDWSVARYYGDDRDSLRLTWEQNLVQQVVYAKVTGDYPSARFHSAALELYPDPSRVIAFEVTCLRRRSGRLVWGGGVTLPVVRFGYNNASDIDEFFGSSGTFVAEIHFALGASGDRLFSPGAAKGAPLDTENLTTQKLKKTDATLNEGSKDKSGAKEITAKGIRREKAQ